MNILLYQPEIPPNTGSIARLCAATNTPLHLVEPLGFSLKDKHLKRAGLDYWHSVDVTVWPGWEACAASLGKKGRFVMTSARAKTAYHAFAYRPGDVLVFGPETRGLPREFVTRYDHWVRIPIWGRVRSLNLANAATLLLYEAFRQTGRLEGM